MKQKSPQFIAIVDILLHLSGMIIFFFLLKAASALYNNQPWMTDQLSTPLTPCWPTISTHFVKKKEQTSTKSRQLQTTPIIENLFNHLLTLLSFIKPVSNNNGEAYVTGPFFAQSFQYSQNNYATGAYKGQCHPTIFLASKQSFVCVHTGNAFFSEADCENMVKNITGHALKTFPVWKNSIFFLTTSKQARPVFKQMAASDTTCHTALYPQISAIIDNIFKFPLVPMGG